MRTHVALGQNGNSIERRGDVEPLWDAVTVVGRAFARAFEQSHESLALQLGLRRA